MKDISEHILDITQNSISANATQIEVTINNSIKKNIYELTIKDNGKGMNEETLKQVIDPFYTSRTTRKVGLGIPLLKQNSELTGGNFSITSQLGVGTTINAVFVNNNIDKLPDGDIAGSIVLLVVANPNIDFIYTHITDIGKYIFNTAEIKQVLGDMPITQPEVRKYLIEMITENINSL